ncbi:MAG: hypothetical protein FWE14_07735 [Lachnospiraceae bacterium]|nr:hypothetical protein [Lachnospiraceae bacterium]
MSDEWLDYNQHESEGATLSGWVWLQKFVYPENEDIPTVIYSKFITVLEDKLKHEGKISELQKGNIKCAIKGADNNEGYKGLVQALKELKIIK